MYFRPEHVLEQYEIEVKSISKGRECYLCETNLGIIALKEYFFWARCLFYRENCFGSLNRSPLNSFVALFYNN